MKPDQMIGGQAVMEGVMMRNRSNMVVACRDPEGAIKTMRQKLSPLAERYPFLGLFFVRGIITFVESLVVGIRALNISTEQLLESEGEEMTPFFTFLSVFLGLAMAILLFFLFPTYLIRFLPELFPSIQDYHVLLNLSEGVLRVGIFVFYILVISRWNEIKGFFAYHGAEHKAINCYEGGEALEVENADKYSTQHARCGTSYLLVVMIVSILVFSFFGWPTLGQRVLIRLVLLPVIAGLAYEAIRWTAQSRVKWVKFISYPGLWLQKLTTREPDRKQLEVALVSLKSILNEEEPPEQAKDGDVCAGEA